MQQQGSKYDPITKERALALIASGLTITRAAKQMGIPKSTVADWWHSQGDADEDAIAARREARRASILKCGRIVDKALTTLDRKISAAGRECKDVDEGLAVLRKGRLYADGSPAAVLTPALLREVYGVSGVVQRDPYPHFVPD